jgi:hypothetical protein
MFCKLLYSNTALQAVRAFLCGLSKMTQQSIESAIQHGLYLFKLFLLFDEKLTHTDILKIPEIEPTSS